MRRPISVREAASILGISEGAVLKRIQRGRLLAVPFSDRGWMVCHEAILGRFDEPADEEAFRRTCEGYATVPEACDLVCATDGMVVRMITAGELDGFRLNGKSWAVTRESCDANLREYISGPPRVGRPRVLHRPLRKSKRPRKKALTRVGVAVESRP